MTDRRDLLLFDRPMAFGSVAGVDEAVRFRAWTEARDAILRAIAEGAPLIALLGPAGSGKTLLLRQIAATLEMQGIASVLVPRGDLDPPEASVRLALIDEAGRLDDGALARLCARATAGTRVVLTDVPRFAGRLAVALGGQATLRPVSVRLGPVLPEEVGGFVAERLVQAGEPRDRFAPDAIAALGELPQLTPRLLNTLAGSALFVAWEEESGREEEGRDDAMRVGGAHVAQAIALRTGLGFTGVADPGPAPEGDARRRAARPWRGDEPAVPTFAPPPVETEAGLPDATRAGPRSGPTDPVAPTAVRPEPIVPEPVVPEPVVAEPVVTEPVPPGPVLPDPVRAEAVPPEAGAPMRVAAIVEPAVGPRPPRRRRWLLPAIIVLLFAAVAAGLGLVRILRRHPAAPAGPAAAALAPPAEGGAAAARPADPAPAGGGAASAPAPDALPAEAPGPTSPPPVVAAAGSDADKPEIGSGAAPPAPSDASPPAMPPLAPTGPGSTAADSSPATAPTTGPAHVSAPASPEPAASTARPGEGADASASAPPAVTAAAPAAGAPPTPAPEAAAPGATSSAPPAVPPATSVSINATVILHYAAGDAEAARQATALAAGLRERHAAVVGPSGMRSLPRVPGVLYFHMADRAQADAVRDVAAGLGIPLTVPSAPVAPGRGLALPRQGVLDVTVRGDGR